ncbi:MAG: hypothetical protein WC898_02835 [Candidatus Paceibacterota bacterium]|jgi:hypothetical protein
MEKDISFFKEKINSTFKQKLPKNPRYSVISGRIILSQKDFCELQKEFIFSDYNMWCTGVNKNTNPIENEMLPAENYIDTGDAENFHSLFITESEAEAEEEEIKISKNKEVEKNS